MDASAKHYMCLIILCLGCSDVTKSGYTGLSSDMQTVTLDGQIMNQEQMDMTPPVVPPTPFPDAAAPIMDMGTSPLDAAPMPDMEIRTGGPCDPREQAGACEEGYYCAPTSEYEGTCEPGTPCDVLTNDGCAPPNGTYCHLIGRTTLCTDEGEGVAGDSCGNTANGAQPCAAGYACNGSICVEVCDPSSAQPCENQGRCADISDAVGQTLGLCVERNCNIYTGGGCNRGEVCRFAVATDGANVGSCRPEPAQAKVVGERCTYGLNDDCEQGLVCVQAPTGDVCRQLCDSGGYEITCPQGKACREALDNAAGTIRGVGVCVTNQ